MHKIFIPFLDRVLDYDCRKCSLLCCSRGPAVSITKKEKDFLLKRYSTLKPFIIRGDEKKWKLNQYGHCFFLEKNGMCFIQKRHGYLQKPFACRSVPFFLIKCRSEYVVYPHSVCNYLYARRNGKVSYKDILKNAKEGIRNSFYIGRINWSRERLRLERKITIQSSRFLKKSNYIDFAVFQNKIINQKKDEKVICWDFSRRITFWKEFLDMSRLNIEDKQLTYEVTVFTPILRITNNYLSKLNRNDVPLALLALYFLLLVLKGVKEKRIFLSVCQQVLNDLCLGLLSLKDKDLEKFKDRSMSEKIIYLQHLARNK